MNTQYFEMQMTQKMRSEVAIRRAHAWLTALAASCGLIPATFAFAVPSVKNGPSRRLEHPT
jgi:hypothetical protein